MSTSGRASYTPPQTVIVQGGDDTPDAIVRDDIEVVDSLQLTLPFEPSVFEVGDSLGPVVVQVTDTVTLPDTSVAAVQQAYVQDALDLTDLAQVQVGLFCRFSFRVRESVPNNSGPVTVTAKSSNGVATDRTHGYLCFDTSVLRGLKTTGGTLSMNFSVSHNGAATSPLSWDVRRVPALPATQDTPTWNNSENSGAGYTGSTVLQSGTINVAAGAKQGLNIPFNASVLTAMLSNEHDLMVRFIGDVTPVTGNLITFTIDDHVVPGANEAVLFISTLTS